MRAAPPPPPAGVLTERQLLAAHPTLTSKAIKRAMSAGTFPRPVPLPAGGRGWCSVEVDQALTARDAPPIAKQVPPTHCSLGLLIGVSRVSHQDALRDCAGKFDMKHVSRMKRVARPGLIELTEEQVRNGVRRGTFPAPTIGPGGVEMWLRSDITKWLRDRAR